MIYQTSYVPSKPPIWPIWTHFFCSVKQPSLTSCNIRLLTNTVISTAISKHARMPQAAIPSCSAQLRLTHFCCWRPTSFPLRKMHRKCCNVAAPLLLSFSRSLFLSLALYSVRHFYDVIPKQLQQLQQQQQQQQRQHNYVCGTGPKVSRKNWSTAFAAKLAPRTQSDENETSNYTKPTLNNSPAFPLSVRRCSSRWFQFNSLFTGRTTLCCAVKKGKKKAAG